MVLLDTCALIWWTLDPEKLSKTAARTCNRIHKTGGVISSISIWEIGIKIKKGRIDWYKPGRICFPVETAIQSGDCSG